MTRCFDAFMFNDELDMLECRLTEIGDLVDAVILVEADVTHGGHRPKPLHFRDHADRFAAWTDKIVPVVATGLPDGDDPWAREHAQREWIWDGLRQVGAEPDDIVLQSDVDEIPSRAALAALAARSAAGWAGGAVLQQRFHPFAVDWRHPAWWMGTVAARVGDIETMTAMRGSRLTIAMVIPDAGWHFSWVGSDQQARDRKMDTFCHAELETTWRGRLEECWAAGIHVDGHPLASVPVVDGEWPRWITDGHAPTGWFHADPPAPRPVPVNAGPRLDLGRAAMEAGAWGRAIEVLGPLVDDAGTATDLAPAERAVAALHLALAHQEIGHAHPVVAGFQEDRRRAWLDRAAQLAPGLRGPWLERAAWAWEHGDVATTAVASRRALDATGAPPPGFDAPLAWDWMVHDLASLSAWAQGLSDDAQAHAHAALAAAPDNARLRQNVHAIARAIDGSASWVDLRLLVPAPMVRGRRVALIGPEPATEAHLRSLDPRSLAVVDRADRRPSAGPLDLVIVELGGRPLAARHLWPWWSALTPGGWLAGRDPDAARVARLTRALYLRFGVRSAVGDGATAAWALRRPD